MEQRKVNNKNFNEACEYFADRLYFNAGVCASLYDGLKAGKKPPIIDPLTFAQLAMISRDHCFQYDYVNTYAKIIEMSKAYKPFVTIKREFNREVINIFRVCRTNKFLALLNKRYAADGLVIKSRTNEDGKTQFMITAAK